MLGGSMAAAAHSQSFCATHTLYTDERSCTMEKMRRKMGDPIAFLLRCCSLDSLPHSAAF